MSKQRYFCHYKLLHIYLVVISFYTICSLLLILMCSVIQFSRWTWIILHSMVYVLLFEHSIGSFKCCMVSNPSYTEIELNIACVVLIMKDMCRISVVTYPVFQWICLPLSWVHVCGVGGSCGHVTRKLAMVMWSGR